MLSEVWTKNDHRIFWVITLSVLAAHIFFVVFLALSLAAPLPKSLPAKPLVVKTISLNPPAPLKTSAPAASSRKKEAPPVKKPAQQQLKPAKEIAPKVIPKPVRKVAPKVPPKTVKEEKPQRSRESIRKIQESLSKIATKSVEKTPMVELPNVITSLAVDEQSPVGEVNVLNAEVHYKDELARRMQLYLTLPERGEVTVKLTLNRSGAVIKLVIESSTTDVNRKYVEKTVPILAFPPFGTFFSSQSQYTFTVALRSESSL